MKLGIFVVYDEKSEAYANPFCFSHKGEAVRAFEDLCKDKNSRISIHLEDYSLYCIGEFDDRAGSIAGKVAPEFIIRAIDFKPDLV
nr:MAG: nonstructural protein [Microviridae sp.]